jgi:type I restriction-modification system specificity subunit
MNKQQEPRLRFKGFTGEWEDKKLGELILYLKGFAFKTENYKDSGIRIIRGLDLSAHSIKNNTDSVFIAISEYTKYQDWEIQENDIIVTTVGSKPHLIDSAVGRAIFVDKEKIGLLNQNLLILRNIEKETNSFIYANLLTQKFHKHIESIQRGNANQSNITVNDLLDFSLFCPPHKEQTTIGNFFRRLDSQIAESRAVLEKSRQLKKTMLAKMFPANGEKIPKIRFKRFEGEWERKILKDVVNVFDNLRIPVSENKRTSGNTPYFGANGIQDYVDGFTHNGEFVLIAEDGANDLKNYPVQYVNGKCWVNNHAHVLQGKSEILNNIFLFSRFQSMDISQFLVGGGRAKLNGSTMLGIEIEFPKDKKEQAAIGNFFRQLDETIALQSAEVEKLNQLKKGLLAAMLV